MSDLEEQDADEDVWHLRQPLVSRTSSVGGLPSRVSDENQRAVNTDQNISQTNIPSGPAADQTETHCHLGEASSPKRSFSVLASIKDTLSSVFHTPAVPSVAATDLLCRVILLDGRSLHFSLKLSAVGWDLFNRVTGYLGLEQDDFFGLTYSIANSASLAEPDDNVTDVAVDESVSPFLEPASVDPKSSWLISSASTSGPVEPPRSNWTATRRRASGRQTRTLSHSMRFSELWKRNRTYVGDVLFWLDLDKRISKQCEGSPYVFHFQVKYFVPHPDRDIYCTEARRHYCLQLRQHLLTGRLPCSFNTHILLGAYISQFVLGDAHPRHSVSSDSVGPSACSSFSSRRDSRAVSQSEARSLGSERACSLAEPESSDLDHDVNNGNDTGSNDYKTDQIAWVAKPRRGEDTPVFRRKCATLGHPGSQGTRPSFDCSRSIRSDSAHSAYLSVLPHLNRISRSSSRGRPRVGLSVETDEDLDDDNNGVLVAEGSCFNTVQLPVTEWAESPGANWPYPSPTGYYCPEMLARIARLHRRFRGMPRSCAERRFLRQAKRLSMYGVELHLVKRVTINHRPTADRSTLQGLYRSLSNLKRSLTGQNRHDLACMQTDHPETCQPHHRLFVSQVPGALPFNFNAYPEFAFALGVCVTGLILYWGQLRVARFSWPRIVEISLQHSNFLLTVRQADQDVPGRVLCYTLGLPSPKLAMHLFASCVGHHRYFRLGAGLSRSPQEVSDPVTTVSRPSPVTAVPLISVTESTTPASRPSNVRERSSTGQQRVRLRHWLHCFIPRTVESDSSGSTRSTQPRRQLRRDRSTVTPRTTAHTRSPDRNAPAILDAPDATPTDDSSNELWLRRGSHAVLPSVIPGSPNPNTSEPGTVCTVPVKVVEATPNRPCWVSRTVVSRISESPIVPTIRRVRSALSGTQRIAAPNATRPVSFSAMHKRAVLNNVATRPIPPPRPKQPPTPADARHNRLIASLTKSSSSNESGKMTPDLLVNWDAIPLVPTYTAMFTPHGILVHTSRLDVKSPTKDNHTENEPSDLCFGELVSIRSGPQQTSTPNHNKVG
ncbi:hypothetical protein FGIG_02668 [Fasciola gigantica]|uniref:FERM domain-containing protein n=1 Tax=Fasciola gigantica TaxID=46835 RepID=A0A504YC15_FASGI|nr:hypothetical protein FGIG_02668 [Fasciola gigantica]